MKHSPAGTGSCFGFEVHTELALRYLRSGGGGPRLTVEESGGPIDDIHPDRLVVEWRPTPERPLRAKLFERTGVYALWIDGGGWYQIDVAHSRILVPPDVDPIRREERLWGLPSGLCFLARGDRSLHAAAVEVDGSAVLLAGPSRHGKTTLAAGFLSHGYRLLAEDLSCYRLTDRPVLFPGPGMLRIRRDIAHRIDLAGAELIAEDEDRAHYALLESWRGTSDPLPIKAIIFLKDSGKSFRLTAVPALAALPDLWLLSLHLPVDADRTAAFQSISALADTVPIFDLVRPVSMETLSEVVASIVEGLGIIPMRLTQ